MRRLGALAALAALLAASPAGGGGERLYALEGSQAAARLTEIDAATLAPRGRSLRVGAFTAERAISPDRSTLALVSQERPLLRFVDLGQMRHTGQAALAEAGEVQWLRWTERGLVALVDLPRGSKLVWLDPLRRQVTRTLRYRGELVDPRLAGGRVVAVEWPLGRIGPVRLDVVEPDGRARSIRLDRIVGGWARRGNDVLRMAEPGLAVDGAGERAWLADADGEICEVTLDSLAVRCNPVRTLAKVGNPWSRRQLKLVAPGTLALSGWEKREAGPRAARSIGLWLVDTSTWRRRLVDRGVDSFRAAQGVVVGVRRNGVTAYGTDGVRRYAIEVPFQLGVLSITGPYLYVPEGGRTVVADLASGRILGRPSRTSLPFQDPETW